MHYLDQGHEVLARYKDFKLRGRADALQRITAILMRSRANSLLLVGPGGVGCTALILGLQALKLEKNAPFDIIGKRFLWLDSDGLFSSGNVEHIKNEFDGAVRVLKQTADSVLVIEDAKDFIEAARNIGCQHFINALFALVRNGHCQVIFESRDEELDVVLKCHSDMSERLTLFDLAEPSGQDLKDIVQDAAVRLAEAYHIKIQDAAVQAAIEMTTKYRTRDSGLSRAQPERSITLLDRALAAYRLEAHQGPKEPNPDWDAKQEAIRSCYVKFREAETAALQLESELARQRQNDMERRKETTGIGSSVVESFTLSANLNSREAKEIESKWKNMTALCNDYRQQYQSIAAGINATLELTRDVVLTEFSRISGIAASKLNENERAKLAQLEPYLQQHIFGQDEICRRVADAIKVGRLGKKGKNPVAFLFLGPSGVGKSELAKRTAAGVYDDEDAIDPVFDMTEYMAKHAVDKLIGAPPGYEGFAAGGILTNLARKNPARAYLFDEIEKAHPDVFNIFLQILRGGRLTDNIGRRCYFDEAMIFMTSNIGQEYFLDPTLSVEEAGNKALEDLARYAKPEFLNRFNGRQNILCFRALELDSILKIINRNISSLAETYAPQGISVTFPEEDRRNFCADHYDRKVGAVGLPSYLQVNLEPRIVNHLLERPNDRSVMRVSYNRQTRTLDSHIARDLEKVA